MTQVEQIRGLTLTKQQVKQYLKIVTDHALKRQERLGENFSDVDFAMGAAVLLAATGHMDLLPSTWAFNPMRNEPIFEAPKPEVD